MQGIFISGRRPKSKKEIKEVVAQDPASVAAEATSLFGNEFGGPITAMDIGSTINFVGPDPERSRKFYGNLTRKSATELKVS